MSVGGALVECLPISKVVRQGCIKRNIYNGIKIDNLQYADDTTLKVAFREKAEEFLQRVEEKTMEIGLQINKKKQNNDIRPTKIE